MEDDFANLLPLQRQAYFAGDVVCLAKFFLGKLLVTESEEGLTIGRITETEAYNGVYDRACHAWNHRKTKRTAWMYRTGGHAYIYQCYGIHWLLNLTTNAEDSPEAVLIRSLEPVYGVDLMLRRRKLSRITPQLTAGPGVLTQAMGIKGNLNGWDLCLGQQLWISNDHNANPFEISASTRIGISYAGEDAKLPWRFWIQGNPFVSRPTTQ